jgi:hypothetical protein
MKFANATNINRKSGVAQWRDLRFYLSDLALTQEKIEVAALVSLQYEILK